MNVYGTCRVKAGTTVFALLSFQVFALEFLGALNHSVPHNHICVLARKDPSIFNCLLLDVSDQFFEIHATVSQAPQ